jgi:hypothetical protein
MKSIEEEGGMRRRKCKGVIDSRLSCEGRRKNEKGKIGQASMSIDTSTGYASQLLLCSIAQGPLVTVSYATAYSPHASGGEAIGPTSITSGSRRNKAHVFPTWKINTHHEARKNTRRFDNGPRVI